MISRVAKNDRPIWQPFRLAQRTIIQYQSLLDNRLGSREYIEPQSHAPSLDLDAAKHIIYLPHRSHHKQELQRAHPPNYAPILIRPKLEPAAESHNEKPLLEHVHSQSSADIFYYSFLLTGLVSYGKKKFIGIEPTGFIIQKTGEKYF